MRKGREGLGVGLGVRLGVGRWALGGGEWALGGGLGGGLGVGRWALGVGERATGGGRWAVDKDEADGSFCFSCDSLRSLAASTSRP